MAEQDCDLDALLDVLDDEELEENDETVEHASAVTNQGTEDKEGENENDDEDQELQRQLAEMERKMKEMKDKLNKSKEKKKAEAPVAVKENSSQNKNMVEVDLFSSPGTNASNERKLKSPVKTQPLKECEREFRRTKYEPTETQWCPSFLRKDTTRLITGAEAEKLKADLQIKDRKKMEEVARQDLMDSSDEEKDEEGNSLLNDYGRDIKLSLGHKQRVSRVQPQDTDNITPSSSNNKSATRMPAMKGSQQQTSLAKKEPKAHFIVERNSGIRISRPKISQVQIQSAMNGRRMVHMSRIAEARASKETDGDWVTIGVLYYKAPHKTSASGNEYSIWKLTDLKGEIKTVTMFLFGNSHKSHWKLPLNKVVGILNPKIMEDRQGGHKDKGELTISIDHPDKLLEIGDSLDLAKCASLKADKTNCTNIVNKHVCEFCTYHVKKAYTAAGAGRAGLMSTFSGLSSEATRNRIMQKVAPLSKGEMFAGGRLLNHNTGGGAGRDTSANLTVGRKSIQEREKDARLLASLGSRDTISKSLSEPSPSRMTKRNLPPTVQFLSSQEKEAIRKVAKHESEELVTRLLAPTLAAKTMRAGLVKAQQKSDNSDDKVVKKSAKSLLMEHSQALGRAGNPKLGRGIGQSDMISIDVSPSVKSSYSASHSRALAILKNKNKSLHKEDPNKVHKKNNVLTPDRVQTMKRRAERSSADDEDQSSPGGKAPASKRSKTDEKESPKTVRVFGREMSQEELDALRSRKSKNQHLLNEAELEAADKYFDTMEKRDEMEEKMLSTFEMKTKAVTCHVCNYTAFKASDICKQEQHRYKVIDAVKRFYHCKDCKKRVTCLTKLPKEACTKCGGSSWVRSGMIAERKGPKLGGENLSVRGNEEGWLGGTIMNANIDI